MVSLLVSSLNLLGYWVLVLGRVGYLTSSPACLPSVRPISIVFFGHRQDLPSEALGYRAGSCVYLIVFYGLGLIRPKLNCTCSKGQGCRRR